VECGLGKGTSGRDAPAIRARYEGIVAASNCQQDQQSKFNRAALTFT
jgi:hypothetical protein